MNKSQRGVLIATGLLIALVQTAGILDNGLDDSRGWAVSFLIAALLLFFGLGTWRSLDTGYDGYHNGSFSSADVSFGAEIEDDLDQDFVRWLYGHGAFYQDDMLSLELPGIHNMLQWLCNIGCIPDGKYLVKLWW